MIYKLFDRKEFYVIASILLAFIFWFFVRQVEDPEQTLLITDIPVVLSGESILETQGLTVSALSETTVDLEIYTNVSVLSQLSNKNLSVSVDVSKVASAGEYSLSYTVETTSSVNSSFMVESRTPTEITVTVEKLYAETFPIEFVLRGSIADGYQAGTYIVNPENVIVSGSVEEISQIDRAVVILDRENLDERFAGDLPIQLLDGEDNVLTDLAVEMSIDTAYVTLPIVVVKEIPLTVSFADGGGATEADIIEYTITPATITVSGAEEDMSGLSEISLGSVDLSKVVGSESFAYTINLDTSLYNVSGINEAIVSVSLAELATKSFDVTNIELINIPDGYTATVTTQVRTIVVRGPQEALDAIDASQIRIVADLDHISAVGSTSVTVKVYLDASSEAGVIGDYSIVISASK